MVGDPPVTGRRSAIADDGAEVLPRARSAGSPGVDSGMGSGIDSGMGPGTWFGALWALAVLFHLAGNGAHVLALDRIGMVQVGLAAAAVLMVLRPSTGAACGLAGLYLMVLWLKLPVVGNHEVILGLVSMIVLISGLRALFRLRLGPQQRSGVRWAAAAAPATRWILIISYGFIAVSKLNSGFFDLAGSCALIFSEAFGSTFGIGQGPVDAAGPAVIVVTAGVELAIPILLVAPRFRTAGAILALGFHFVLALDPASHVWDFSAVLLPMFLLFMPSGFHRVLDRAVGNLALRPLLERTLVLGILVAGHGVVATGATPLPTWAVAYPAWLALAFTICFAAAVFALSDRSRQPPPGGDGGWRVAGLFVPVIMLAAVIGLGPYLEYRTAAAFNMYSNLQVVDGTSNHYLLGSLVPRTGASTAAEARSVLEVVSAGEDSPLRYYIDRGLAVPVENLRRYLADHPEDLVTVRQAGREVSAADAGLTPAERPRDLRSRLWSHLGYKLAFRRAVDLSPPRQCLRSWGPIG